MNHQEASPSTVSCCALDTVRKYLPDYCKSENECWNTLLLIIQHATMFRYAIVGKEKYGELPKDSKDIESIEIKENANVRYGYEFSDEHMIDLTAGQIIPNGCPHVNALIQVIQELKTNAKKLLVAKTQSFVTITARHPTKINPKARDSLRVKLPVKKTVILENPKLDELIDAYYSIKRYKIDDLYSLPVKNEITVLKPNNSNQSEVKISLHFD